MALQSVDSTLDASTLHWGPDPNQNRYEFTTLLIEKSKFLNTHAPSGISDFWQVIITVIIDSFFALIITFFKIIWLVQIHWKSSDICYLNFLLKLNLLNSQKAF